MITAWINRRPQKKIANLKCILQHKALPTCLNPEHYYRWCDDSATMFTQFLGTCWDCPSGTNGMVVLWGECCLLRSGQRPPHSLQRTHQTTIRTWSKFNRSLLADFSGLWIRPLDSKHWVSTDLSGIWINTLDVKYSTSHHQLYSIPTSQLTKESIFWCFLSFILKYYRPNQTTEEHTKLWQNT